ncbi:MAG: chromate efflux transporter [Planctomycetia bacterium]|nr:chromate efflux transporter [Planctomycetia bacterium]
MHSTDRDDAPAAPTTTPPAGPRAAWEVATVFLRLGCLSFGGPIAHLGFFRAEFVERRRWIDDARFGDLVALCQFLPGPASSQVAFALGMHRAGFVGAVLASIAFLLPSAVLMIAFAYGIAAVGDLASAGWIHGLKLGAVAVVAQAVWGMGRNLCPDRARVSVALAAAALLLAVPSSLVQVAVIVAGAVLGAWRYREAVPQVAPPPVPAPHGHHLVAGAALVAFVALFLALPALAASTRSRPVAVADAFYRSGALVFGGGHVVLPMLRAEVVPAGWVADEQFLAGYGAAQALPGPLFAFAGYLGAAMGDGPDRWLGGVGCLVAIFLPAWLLVGGALPFWHGLRARRGVQAALAGANAAVVGVLLAALYRPVVTESVHAPTDVAAVLMAFGLLQTWRCPAWLVVLFMAAVGPLLRGG